MKKRTIAGLIAIVVIASVAIFSGCVEEETQSQVQDSDGDGWTDQQEINAGTDPYNKDTDGDGYWDPKDENPLDQNVPEEDLPVINYFDVSPININVGESSTLNWAVSDALNVTIDHEIGKVALTGTRQVSPTKTTTYTLTATNEAGKRDATVEVVIEVPQDKPVIKYFKASPSEIKPDESATLSWDVSDATSVTIEPEIGSVALTGTRQVSPTETTTYTIKATTEAGSVDATVEVIVEVPPEMPIINYFEASPSEIKPDESATLSWDVSDATSVTIEPGIGAMALTGTRQVYPAETTTYTLTATNEAGSVDATVKVIVEIREDCINFNYQQAEVQQIKGRWKIVVESMRLMDFDNNEAEARKALEIIKHYGMNSQCFVGRPDSSMEYYLVNGQTPTGYFSGEDCISFNQATIEVKQVNNRWKIVDGYHYILDFETKEDEARTAFNIIKKYEFNRICFVGRPDPSMTYFRST